ncbi:MAG: hypothetical protein V2B18_22715 [Pseudomonadota bacterium]
MPPQLKLQGVNVVLRGNFNPPIFHPSWFALNGLLRDGETKEASIQIIHPSVAVFSAEWLEINVVQDRFEAATTQGSHFEALRDLVVGILTVLNHTPVRMMGINHTFVYDLQSEEMWHKAGHTLVPEKYWESLLDQPGMRSLTIEARRTDGLVGRILTRVEPSREHRFGLYCEINDHYEFDEGEKQPRGIDEATRVLMQKWTESMKLGEKIAMALSEVGQSQ